MATNTEILINAIKALPEDKFGRNDVWSKPFPNAFSPTMSFIVRAGLVVKESKSVYVKTSALKDQPIEELIGVVAKTVTDYRAGYKRPAKVGAMPKEPESVEVDLYEILDELPLEVIFDVLAAKFNTLAARPLVQQSEISSLHDIIRLRDNAVKSAEVDQSRLIEKIELLTKENAKLHEELARFLPEKRHERLVMAKPINASGTGVFRDTNKGIIKVYRQHRR